MTHCRINVAGLECDQPVAGRIHWTGEGYADEACKKHLGLMADTTGHRVEWYPVCQIEILDPYSRVDLIQCTEMAVGKAQWDERGAAWVCIDHLVVLSEAN
jgi:hypothetical protein